MRLGITLLLGALWLSACASVEKSWKGPVSPTFTALGQKLSSGEKITLAIVTNIETSFSAESFRQQGGDIEQWRRGMRNATTADAEQQILEGFGNQKKFRLVDRTSLDKITDELALSAGQEISDETRLKIGTLTGATHLLLITVFRSPAIAPWMNDSQSVRLVDSQTGQLLASQNSTVHFKPH